MISYNTFERNKNGFLTQNDVKESKIDYGDSITDKSKYNPNMSSFIANQGAINNNPLYHFNDGKDNGLNMSIITNNRLDITEKEAIYKKLQKSTNEEIEKLYERLEEEERSSDDDNSSTTEKESIKTSE